MRKFLISVAIAALSAFISCNGSQNLKTEIENCIYDAPATVGVAVIGPDGDTTLVNNDICYPLMSVFKLHEALAVAATLDKRGETFDRPVDIDSADINPGTWSPMVKIYGVRDTVLTVDMLLSHLLLQSDNNASNILFDKIVSVAATDSIVKSIADDRTFTLRYTERQMQRDHDLSYDNCSSPLACASLIGKVFGDSLVSTAKQNRIAQLLTGCESAPGRIAAAAKDIPGVKLAHRTGSGYTNDAGCIVAVNDVACIELPDGRRLSLAILVKDYAGNQDDADALIARIARKIINYYL
ncbi:MAG: serine hydrolase [Bacteroidales bacterium]|nr:serine hydrolase [Bacteroidales bacterium]